jgi:hypothetical protein
MNMTRTLEQKIERLEETVKLLYSVVIEKKSYVPGQEELDRAIEAAAFHGDIQPLVEYKRRGGIIPDVPDHRQRGGRRRQGSALCGAADGNPCQSNPAAARSLVSSTTNL